MDGDGVFVDTEGGLGARVDGLGGDSQGLETPSGHSDALRPRQITSTERPESAGTTTGSPSARLPASAIPKDVDHPGYLLRLSELELIHRHHRIIDRRIKLGRFPAVKSLDAFDFLAMLSVNKHLVMQLARCEYIDRSENVIAVGNSAGSYLEGHQGPPTIPC